MTPALLLIAATLIAVACATADRDTQDAVTFLRRYGYLTTDVTDNDGHETQYLSLDNGTTLRQAIMLFQEYYHLPGYGLLDNQTIHWMRKPRCGVRDMWHHESGPAKWSKKHLTWNFRLANAEHIRTAETAFAMWAANSSLTFARDTLNPDILISFQSGQHMFANDRIHSICPERLDGPGTVLAHAFLPTGSKNYVSEVHIDREESWHIRLNENPSGTQNLLMTLTHEIGHSLGLHHSSRQDSIMFAFMPTKQFPVHLGAEDIIRIQNLYGLPRKTPKKSSPTTTTTTTTMRPVLIERDLCELERVDAALVLNRKMYIANGLHLWSIDLEENSYIDRPILLTDYMSFLPKNFTHLSGVYQRPSGDITLFVDNSVYMVTYPEFALRSGWPKTLEELRFPPGIHINAVLNTNAGRTFVIYNDYIAAEINECSMSVSKHVPLNTFFPGLPAGVTSAFRHIDGHLYFLDGRRFYKFNEFTRTVIAAGKFNLEVVGITCPKDGLLRQLRDLLNHLTRVVVV